jgi:SAM-dependent methyltransferase
MLTGMAETHFDEWMAGHYQQLWPELFDPAVVDPAVDLLARLAGSGRCLEFGIGTGRIALPLRRRGLPVEGIELSPAMVAMLHAEPDAAEINVTIGDCATADAGGHFSLVYLLRNTITNLTTQDEQVDCFRNAARHLEPGGFFLIENYVPQLRRLPPGETARVFIAEPEHVGFEEYDIAAQIAVSHHYWVIDGQLKVFSSPHRYLWPSELDLMARLAGLRVHARWGGWQGEPFTTQSSHHISVWVKPADEGGSP